MKSSELMKLAAGGEIPDTRREIAARRSNQLLVWAKVGFVNHIRVAGESSLQSSGSDIPDADNAIPARSDERLAVARQTQTHDAGLRVLRHRRWRLTTLRCLRPDVADDSDHQKGAHYKN